MCYDSQEAIEKKSFFKRIRKINKGNVQKGFEESDHILEGELSFLFKQDSWQQITVK